MAKKQDETARRMQLIVKHGGTWLPPQTLSAFAANTQLTDDAMLGMIEATRKAIVKGFHAAGMKADDGWKQFTDDPVLQKRTSLALAVKRYVSGAIGPWPIKDEDVGHIQKQLQKQGFGADLSASGAWSPGWDAAYHQWTDKLYTSQLAGKNNGSITFGKALHFMSAVLPKEAANAIIGTAKALPGAARQLAADAAGGVTFAGGVVGGVGRAAAAPITHDNFGFSDIAQAAGNADLAVNTDVQNALGGNTTRGANRADITKHPIGRIASDVGTMLIVHDALKLGAQASLAIGEGALKAGAADLTQAEASRAGGVITRTIDRSAGTAAERAPGAIGRTVGRVADAVQRDSNLFSNIPGATRVGGWVGKLADADGLYYKARTLAATPYRVVPGLAAAGEATSALGIEGAKLRGVGAVTGGLGSDTLRQINRQDTGVLNTADDAIRNRLDFTVLGKHIQPSLDDLAFFLHGPPEGEGAASAKVGRQVDDVRNGLIDAMGRVDLGGAIERGTGVIPADAIAHMGGVENYTTFWSENIYGHAANWWADQHIDDAVEALSNPNEAPLTSLERTKLHRQLSHEARVNPDIAHEAVRGLVAQDGGEELAKRIRKDITNSDLSARDYLKGNGKNWVEASKIVKNDLLPFFKPANFDETGFVIDPAEAAKLGLARVESLTKQSGHRLVNDLRAQYEDLVERSGAATDNTNVDLKDLGARTARAEGPTSEEWDAFNSNVRKVLHKEFNVDSLQMPHALSERIEKLSEFTDGLAADAYPRVNASTGEVPHELTAAIGRLREMGYKPVFGTDIGWLHAGENQLDVMAGPLTTQRKVIEKLGLSMDNHGSAPITFYRRDGIRNELQKLVDGGKVKLPDSWTPDTVIAYLEDKRALDKSPGGLFRAAAQLHVSKGAKLEAERLLEAEGVEQITKGAVRNRAAEEAIQALQLRDVPRKNVLSALTDAKAFSNIDPEAQAIAALDELPRDVAPFTKTEANEIYRAIVKGSAAPKGYLLGLSRIDDLFRASMGFAGSGAVGRATAGAVVGAAGGTVTALQSDHPDLGEILKDAATGGGIGAVGAALGGDRLGWYMANLPNRLVQLRNDLRFTLSPAFSFRRIAKTNVKLQLEGIAPTFDPLTTMEKAGTLAEDRARLRDVLPGAYNEISDDADRYLRENDVFGFYNARNYEAYGLGEWARAHPEATAEQQKAFINKTFAYGSRTQEGRTALERSANFVFFPFSFDKTLYRNLGGYLLDRPAQQILLTKALAAYNQFNSEHMDGKNPLAASWWEKHVPVLNEALRLNAFAHGLSPGELGGINRPLLNLFLPQSWSSSTENLDTLHRFVPALKDFDRLNSELSDQGAILKTVGDNMLAHFHGEVSTPGKPTPVAESRQAQIEDGFAMQRSWYDAYGKVLDYNAGRSKDKQLRFPLDADKSASEQTWGPYAGEPITRDNVNRIIAAKYPAFNPAGGAVTAVERKAELKTYLLKQKGTVYGDYAQQIFDAAAKLETVMSKPSTTAAQASVWTTQIRTASTWLAEHDANFYKLYNRNLRRAFGPLEGVSRG